VVVDSFSTDRTPEIARSFAKVRCLQRPYKGSASQKNWAMDQTRFEWLLIFDADERCTPELQAEIAALLASGPRADAYTIKRRVYFMDREIRYSGWQHDRVVRLVKRGAGATKQACARGHADARPGTRSEEPMLHYMIESFDQ